MASTPTTHSRRALALAAVGCALVLAACSSSSKPHAPAVQRPCGWGSSSQLACARTAFPASPTRRPAAAIQIPVSLAKNPSPAFTSAMQACKYLMAGRSSAAGRVRQPKGRRGQARAVHARARRPQLPRPHLPGRALGTAGYRGPRDKPRLTSVRGRLQNMSIAMKYTVNSVARTGLDPTPPYAGSPTRRPRPRPTPATAAWSAIATAYSSRPRPRSTRRRRHTNSLRPRADRHHLASP